MYVPDKKVIYSIRCSMRSPIQVLTWTYYAELQWSDEYRCIHSDTVVRIWYWKILQIYSSLFLFCTLSFSCAYIVSIIVNINIIFRIFNTIFFQHCICVLDPLGHTERYGGAWRDVAHAHLSLGALLNWYRTISKELFSVPSK